MWRDITLRTTFTDVSAVPEMPLVPLSYYYHSQMHMLAGRGGDSARRERGRAFDHKSLWGRVIVQESKMPTVHWAWWALAKGCLVGKQDIVLHSKINRKK